ncbi:Fc.00g076080.m01.CDS01 [Cosmosporella sp. VM-42]
MPYFKTSQEWLEQSTLLLEARPATTRITTKYSIKPAPSSSAETTPKPPRGNLVLKTYDPVSGVTLKYRTTKAAEVSRLIYASLGRLGRNMAAVPVEETMPDVPPAVEEKATVSGQQTPQQGGGGGGKKKKKGKK